MRFVYFETGSLQMQHSDAGSIEMDSSSAACLSPPSIAHIFDVFSSSYNNLTRLLL